MKRIITTSLFLCVILVSWGQDYSTMIWYDKPAGNWNEALPIGNGRLAAMVFGGPTQERLQLNEETVWAGEPGNNLPPTNFYETLPELRKLIFEEKHDEAQQLAMKMLPRHAGPSNNYGMPYQPVGDFFITFPNHQTVTNYKRTLDLDRAIATTSYQVSGVNFTREVFTSVVDNVIVFRITADKPRSINCSLTLTSAHQKISIRYDKDQASLTGSSGSRSNKTGKINFTAFAKASIDGGRISPTDSAINIYDANTLTVYISMATNFKNYHDISADGEAKAKQYLTGATKKSFETLKSAHIDYYQKLFHRVTLDLGSTSASAKPTDVRLTEFKETNDPGLVALYFQFGRYLLISSSQPGSQPANLQGKWNDKIDPPWDSKYTVNINTEMNYWPAEVTNLSELHGPLFSMLKDLEVTGAEVAQKLYHARGWVVHHNTDLWRIAAPVDGAYYGLWPMGGAWLSQHIWQHYLYTGDSKFLSDHYSLLKGAALFCSDILVKEPTHQWLVVAPSMSPENEHHQGVSITAGTTMDNQLVFDVFSNFIQASTLLKKDPELRDSISAQRKQLPPMQIGRFGQLTEWLSDWDNPEDKHRHVSHLYGLYPSGQISLFRSPELFQAARTSLVHRGDHSTGWSMGWKVNLWARLLDGDRAYQLINEQLTPVRQGDNHGGTYLNLLDAHPPFQIDGNFGCTSGIAEMLVQSHDGVVYLLPALPKKWPSGTVNGLRTRGGFIIDMTWNDSKVVLLRVTSTLGGNCRIRTGSPLAHQLLKQSSGENSNKFFVVEKIKPPSHTTDVVFASPALPVHYEYDLETKKNKTYTFKFTQ